MEPARGRVQRAVNDLGSADFFLPDLCASRSVFVMVLLAELLALVHVLASSSLPQFDWDLLGSTSLYVQWVVLLSAALLCRLRQPLSRLDLPLASFCSLLLVVTVTVATSYLAVRFVAPALPEAFIGWRLLRDALIAAVLAGMVLRYFYLQQQLQRQQKLELQARLDSLRARIRPHFLFNTLNSIASLIGSRPDAAEQAVEDLSELFRVNLQESSRSMTVADELRLCELYLGIEQLRLGERLRVVWEVPSAVRELPMPSLLLQPLVENAIYHGVSQLPDGGTVRICLSLDGDTVEAIVQNPVPSRSMQSGGHNLALGNIRERLEAIYGSQGLLLVEPQGDLFTVKLRYPLEEMV